MKRNLIYMSITLVIIVFIPGYMSAAEVKLQVLNPRGEITLPPVWAPGARITDLAGRKAG